VSYGRAEEDESGWAELEVLAMAALVHVLSLAAIHSTRARLEQAVAKQVELAAEW
jgi:hypothetical protein